LSNLEEYVPARIILSRKGWDAKAGGWPNPILPDGFPLSFPIPDGDSGITYGDLRLPDGRPLVGKMVEQLTNGKITSSRHVHLDPDIRDNSLPRRKFYAAFGQCGASQSHLWNQNIRPDQHGKNNDLFLYFGRFRSVECIADRWRYRRGAPELQIIFGWLQIGTILPLAGGYPDWAKQHPHCIESKIVKAELGNRRVNNNTLYVACTKLSFADKPGAGVFEYFDQSNHDPKRLTDEGCSASMWRLPNFFHRPELAPLSNMGQKVFWNKVGDSWRVQRRGPGQEFVLQTEGRKREVLGWLRTLFAAATDNKLHKVAPSAQ
jgi:hypothetical protein